MKLLFKASINSDIWNWEVVLGNKKSFGLNWLEFFPKDISKKDARDKKKLRAYLNKKYYKKGTVKLWCDWLQIVMKPEVIDESVYKVTGKHVPFKVITVVPTTYKRYPYDYIKGAFFISYGAPTKNIYQVGIHECMHMVVHKHYWNMMLGAGLDEQQAHHIKEALTVLLDPIFKEKWNWTEEGYPIHQNLRKDIKRISKKAKNFDEIMDKTIKLYLKKYIKKVS